MQRRCKITKAAVDNMRPPNGREAWLWDAEVRGFGVRARGDVRTYVLRYAAPGRPGASRWLTIGTHGRPWRPDPVTGKDRNLTADLARHEAVRLLGIRIDGRDPAGERELSASLPTFERFSIDRYMLEHSSVHKAAKSSKDDRRMLTKLIHPAFGKERIDRVTGSHVTRLHNAMKDTPFAANRCLSLVSHVFTMARVWGVLPATHANPCLDVRRFPEPKRKRYLSAAERPQIGAALAAAEAKGREPRKQRKKGEGATAYAIAALRVIMLSGARPDEIVRLRRAQLAELVNQKGKTGERGIYFDKHALAIMEALPPRSGNPFVFVGRRIGRHLTVTALSQLWKRIARGAGIDDVRLYDARHTFASVAVQQGLSLPIIGELLGHKRGETTQRYAHLADNPVRAASDEVSAEIAKALDRGPKVEAP